MPRDPGQYTSRLRRLVCSRPRNASSGSPEPTFTGGDYYWAKVDITGSTMRDDYDSQQPAVTSTIFVHGSPTLTALDRLQDEDGLVWRIDTLYSDGDELVCDCFRLDGGGA